MGGKTSGQAAQAFDTLQIQSSAYGIPITILGGVTRVAGNLIYYNDFISHPHSSSGGGKGGSGGGGQPSSYTYTANVLMALCHGQITAVPRIWKGQIVYSDTTGTTTTGTPENIAYANENYAVPANGKTISVTHASRFGSLTSLTAFIYNPRDGGFQVSGALDVDYTQNNGVFTIPAGSSLCGTTITISYTYLNTYASSPALQQMGLSLMPGYKGQSAPSWVTSLHPGAALGYSNLACVTGQNYSLNSSAQVDNHNFEVVGPGAYSIGQNVPDIDIAQFAVNLLKDLRYGAMIPSQYINTTAQWTASNLANNLLFSPALDTQIKAADFIAKAAMLTNVGLVWSAGSLKFIPYCDAQVSGNGVTYTPNQTPIYSLTDDVFITTAGDPPVQITRKSSKDCFNHFRVSFKNRGNSYASEIAEAKDSADIQTNTIRSANIVDASWCCDANIARNIAQFLLQRSLNIRGTYEFVLPWNFIFLEPMDIVSITDVTQGLNKYAVRVTKIEENDGDLKFTCEDFHQGVANTAQYSTQIGAGFGHNYNVAPGNANTPVIFEAPVTFTSNGLEVSIAASSNSATWGGCFIWISLDGTNYKQAGKVTGNARYGYVANDAGATMSIAGIQGSILSGSAADSAAYTTLCYIGGATPEYVAYQGAALTAAGAYTLSGMTRAGYNTSQAAQASGAPFVRVDDNVIQSGAVDLAMIGKAIYIKICGFNVYGGAIQSLDQVPAYQYTIQGTMLKLPPAPPTNLTATFQNFGIFLICGRSTNPDIVRYEYRIGPDWATSTLLTHDGSTSYTFGLQAVGTYLIWVAAVDIYGNYSAPTSDLITVSPPVMNTLTNTINGQSLQLNWTATASSFGIFEYEVRYGVKGCTFAAAASLGFYNTNTFSQIIIGAGNHDYLVAAIDVAGNYSVPLRNAIVMIPPSAPVSPYVNVIDNDVLIYWSAPPVAANQLPIASYNCYQGATFSTSALIGNNGNSTFAFVFESIGGNYTFWMTGIDTSGVEGAPVSIAATVSPPPDFVLQNNFNSTFGGTLQNAYIENSAILLPFDTTKTWATHYTSNGFNTPNDQIAAGFPLYAEPSLTAASYTELINYGVVIPSTIATATLGSTSVAGSVAIAVQMYWKLNSGDAWTALAPGTVALIPSNFQYFKVVYSFTSTAGANLLKLNSLNLKLSVKLRNDSGTGTSAVGGTTINFSYPFIAANTPAVTPNGLDKYGKPYNVAVIYQSVPDPTYFSVRIFDSAGTETAGVGFSWTARGY